MAETAPRPIVLLVFESSIQCTNFLILGVPALTASPTFKFLLNFDADEGIYFL